MKIMAQAAAVSVAQELDKLKMLSAVDQRKAAAILGALVADAASKVPPHKILYSFCVSDPRW